MVNYTKDKDYTKGKNKSYDIKIYDLERVYASLNKIFRDVVIIGGRAVNFYCFNNTRSTHDIDVVVNFDGKSIRWVKDKALEEGFMY